MSRWALMLSCCTLCWGLVGCEEKDPGEDDRVTAILALQGDPVAGQGTYDSNCSSCHALDGSGASGPALTALADPELAIATIIDGKGAMQPYGGLADQDIANCYAYIETL